MNTFLKICKRLLWFLLALPALIALFDLFTFGISPDHILLQPLVKPRLECINYSNPEKEGRFFLYKTLVKVKEPLYRKILPSSLSMPYTLILDGKDHYTFYLTNSLNLPDNAQVIDTRYSSTKSIIKSIHINHRFVDRKKYQFNISVSGPSKLLEEQCSFDYYLRF